MDEKIYDNIGFEYLEDFISLLEEGLSETDTKILEIRKHIDISDYCALQSIIDILFSNSDAKENEKIIKIKNMMLF
ncbi:hypothetical protein J2X97_002212 [Epilithonimonas hungarica]|jgi:hypothetical protein|uniref:hypothetical protein n=1 Tax=Epilithonimonas hungarica TaxID=454006 RepID=UPI0027860D05|nr:hypothetical protein [Epilithonimonas hungarica]MDP9956553.1 hypothetical protein [Epilithonimonas hungarica]